ncbi:MAG: aspartyl/glutamyl-tRNA amidotransferase subunit A [Elusimicrobia bacterium RIFOXYC2_FULL_34_12]|nr:MAG: aspartyl/glutamyl-tRNA amidotransferase subunit A [Elusimicrobia bacterium RIFOXYC2_FULL_34_12]OGS38217.1 MAG: aspartyl/glutamyl-tRNA amidotransferase subunit A [Elusimicrobia bacterium RIFOXYD2_FULL_34_30]HAM38175.1 Asp-tRNA(Asn)/Glu-tRNA(Gln) amidotransferase GatCAB subunit A [Elusimicrobiota bacterium]
MELYNLTACEIIDKIKKKEISAKEVINSFLQRVEKFDKKLCAFNSVFSEKALKQADEIDKKNNKGMLAGLPIAIKDNMCINGEKTTCSSKILKNYVAPYDATVIEKLKSEDAIFIGKTNMDEFAMGSSTENSAFFTTKNPWDINRIPGGSSGGSAVAVSAAMSPVSLGSDTGGSIRQPASLCGVVGMKPTYGRVSRYGLIAFASSLDQIGPFSKDIRDNALILQAISGYDKKDSTSINIPVDDYLQEIEKDIKGLKIGLPKEYFVSGMDREVEKTIKDSVNIFEKMGAQIKEVSLPHTKYAVSVYYIIAPSEASANLARYDGVKYGFRAESDSLIEMYEKTRAAGFGSEVKRRIMLGTYTLSSGYYDAYYLKAQKVRTLIKNDFDEVFKDVDIILTPTSPSVAFKIGEKTADPLQMYLSDIFTISCNLAGICGISIPCGFSSDNLPIGLQLLGKPFDEKTILKAGHNFQKQTNHHLKTPNV